MFYVAIAEQWRARISSDRNSNITIKDSRARKQDFAVGETSLNRSEFLHRGLLNSAPEISEA